MPCLFILLRVIYIRASTMLQCQRGKDLLLDLKRSDWLPPYDDEGFRSVLTEMEELFSRIHEIAGGGNEFDDIPDSRKVILFYNHQCMSRNRRYIFAYLEHRLSKIRNLRWETGAVVPDHIGPKLSPLENDYFMEYNDMLTTYCGDIRMDLTSDLEPPRDLLIEIRALKDCGEIMTENGPIHLDSGTTHYLRRTDVEHLIRQGHVEHVHNE